MRSWKALCDFGYMMDDGMLTSSQTGVTWIQEEWGVSVEKLELWESMGGYVEEVV